MREYLKKQRQNIDKIDTQIITLLEKRFSIAKKLVDWKKTRGLPVEDLTREKEIISRCNHSKLPKRFLRRYYKLLFDEDKK